jgi:hypothetical protein
MENKLYVGFTKNVALPKGGCLMIDDEVPALKRARVFDVSKHCFNPLKGLDYKRARQIADVLYTISPQGENTLTVRNGKRRLLQALLSGERLDQISYKKDDDELRGMIDDLLASPVLRRVLCNPTNFSFNPRSTILARVSRKELGEFDALVLGLFLMARFEGQLVVPDLGFYGRDAHVSLLREGRLIAGVNTLGELTPQLRRAMLLVKDKVASGTTLEDAETLAAYARHARGTNGFNEFVQEAMVNWASSE